jgi:hypothetical protein
MTDETTSIDQSTPETPAIDLDTLVNRINAENEKRFRGFQSAQDRRDEEFRKALDELKDRDLTPEEREVAESSKLQQEIEKLRRENEILSLRKTHPEEADLLNQFLKAPSLQDQLELLSNFRKVAAPAAPEGDEPEAAEGGEPTPVDKNNPARKTQPSLESAAERMNAELSRQIMEGSGNEKGILSRLRRG